MPLDAPGAARAVDERLARPLGLAPTLAAAGLLRLADVKMALAVRSITTERGLDPRDYALVAYGGGGPLHAVAIARELAIPRVVVPPSPSTFSAWGMLAADLRHDLVRTVLESLARTDAAWATARYGEMQRELEGAWPALGVPTVHRAADLRYVGQEHTVTVPVSRVEEWTALRGEFDAAHQRAYGYAAPDVDVQLTNLRLTVVFPIERPVLAGVTGGRGAAPVFETRPVYSLVVRDAVEHRVYQRDSLGAGDSLEGPAAVEEAGTTTILDQGDRLTVEPHGCLVIEVGRGA
jgi:N-methylhydantoinase A